MEQSEVDEAIRLWTGFGVTPWPKRSAERLREVLGDVRAAQMEPVVRALEDDFYASDARDRGMDLQEMSDLAIEDFRRRHPEVGEDAAEAFAWCYTWDHK